MPPKNPTETQPVVQPPQPQSVIPTPQVLTPHPQAGGLSPMEESKTEEPKDDGNSKKNKFLEKLLEIDLGIHLLFTLLIIVSVVTFVFINKNGPQLVSQFHKNSGELTDPNTPKSPRIAEAGSVYINKEQIVSIDKAFQAKPSTLRLTVSGQLNKEVFGYLPYWSVDHVNEINTQLLTSVSYFGLEVDGKGEFIKEGDAYFESWDRWQNDKNLESFIQKLKRNRTKVLLTVKAFNNQNIESIVLSEENSKKFIDNVMYQVNSRALNGITVDFEYIGTPPDEVRNQFTLLMINLNKELKRQNPKNELVIATYATSAQYKGFFDVEILSGHADALAIMGYDFHTPKSVNAGSVAPMGGSGDSLLAGLNAYLDKVPADKLILTVPYYGYGWETVDGSKNGNVIQGSIGRGFSYAEIAENTRSLKINWDEDTQTPWYSYREAETGKSYVVHYDDTRSLGIKYDFVNNKQLRGVGVWALGMDGKNVDLLQLLADKFTLK